MNKISTLILLLLSSTASATWQGKLDLNPTVSPILIRELHDGQWIAGVTKENLWHLDKDGIQRFHAGVFQAWNAEHGNASTGMVIGVDVPVPLSYGLKTLGEGFGLPSVFKPATLFSSMLSFDVIGGFRPFHSADVNGNWVYGLGAKLGISFGVKELQDGL